MYIITATKMSKILDLLYPYHEKTLTKRDTFELEKKAIESDIRSAKTEVQYYDLKKITGFGDLVLYSDILKMKANKKDINVFQLTEQKI